MPRPPRVPWCIASLLVAVVITACGGSTTAPGDGGGGNPGTGGSGTATINGTLVLGQVAGGNATSTIQTDAGSTLTVSGVVSDSAGANPLNKTGIGIHGNDGPFRHRFGDF